MSSATLRQKLTFDELRRNQFHVRLAVSCREAARQRADLARPLRAKMRVHALQARGKIL